MAEYTIEVKTVVQSYEVKNGKKVAGTETYSMETTKTDYDDAITFIKALCVEASKPRIKGYKPVYTYSADDNTVHIEQVKSKQ